MSINEMVAFGFGFVAALVAVGGYRTEDAARAQAQELERYGVKNATAAQRPGTVSFTSVVLRDPPSSAVSRVRELQAAFPAAEVKVGTCASS